RDIIKNSLGVGEVLVVTNKGDGDIVREALEKIKKHIFRADGRVKILVHEEATRRGQWLGLLDAYEGAGRFDEDGVSIGGMYPGKGTRMSPITQRLHGIKPFCPMLIRGDENSGWFSGAAASLFTWDHVAYHLKRMGFKGMAGKWGDEPQIAATRLKDLDWDLGDVDFVRFGSRQVITENLAVNKEWFKVNEKNDFIVQIRRRPRKDLLQRLELKDTPDASAIVHIGSPAFSYLFLEEALKIFGGRRGWIDVDGYLCDALTLDEDEWNKEIGRKADDPDLQQLLKDHPDFYSACQKLKSSISARRGGDLLKIKVIDFGKDLYWGDIGQLAKARQSLHLVAEKTGEGEFARELAAIDNIRPDRSGNIVVGDSVYPEDGSVKNSVLIDTRLYGKVEIDGAVLVRSFLKDASIKEGSVVYGSAVSDLKMAERAFSFRSVREGLEIDEDGVHTSIPVDLKDAGKELEDWRADSRLNVGSAENYKEKRFGNPVSFEEKQMIMRQREVPPALIEEGIHSRHIKPLIGRMKDNEEHG
ncbi:MAG: hypothetical protein WBD17_00595, partial [Candidatus Omnitrophota bacterium]